MSTKLFANIVCLPFGAEEGSVQWVYQLPAAAENEVDESGESKQ